MAELTVMTWNVQNLLPVGHEGGPATDEEYAAKLAALAAVIDRVVVDPPRRSQTQTSTRPPRHGPSRPHVDDRHVG